MCLLTYGLSIFGFMHGFWMISIANMMYTKLQNHENVVGEHGILTFEVVVVVWCFCVYKCTHALLFLDKWFVQIFLNVS